MVLNIKCPDCGFVTTKNNLARHKKSKKCKAIKHRVVSGPAQTQSVCEVCGATVLTSNILKHKKSKQCTAVVRDNDQLPLNTNCKGSKPVRIDEEGDSSFSKKRRSKGDSRLLSQDEDPKPSTSSAMEPTLDGNFLPEIVIVEKSFNDRLQTAYLNPNKQSMHDPPLFLHGSTKDIVMLIEKQLLKCELKVNFVLLVEYVQPHLTDEVRKINFKTKNQVVLLTTDVLELYKIALLDLLKEMEDFHTKGSGWTLKRIQRLELRINRYTPLRGSSFIDLPAELKLRKAIINVMNRNDNKCFLWSVLAGLHPAGSRNPNRVSTYQRYEHEFDAALRGIAFPVKLKDVQKFEKRTGISINVYAYKIEKVGDTKQIQHVIFPLLVTHRERPTHIDLLYITDRGNSHYCLIKSMSRLIRSQITNHEGSIFICKRCLTHFTREDILQKHSNDCNNHEAVRIVMPEPGTTVHFNSHHRKMRVPFAIYVDFESMLIPEPKPENSLLNTSSSHRYQSHHAISFCIYVVCKSENILPIYKKPITYFGIDAAEKFMIKVKEITAEITKLYTKDAAIKMVLTPEDLAQISNATVCHICEDSLKGKKTKKGEVDYAVRDHDHLTGEFRGMAHNSCNLRFQKPKFIPIFIHNLSKYDTHLFIKMVSPNETIEVIPNTEENYISYTIRIKDSISLRFLDSFRFMASSLDTLSSNLTRDQLKHTSKHFDADKIDLVVKKGVYPFDTMNSLEKYSMTSLPPKKDFYNRLTKTEISDEDYSRAQEVWNKFNINNMKEYTLIYNKSDVLLLADVMESFRDLCLATYGLDPAWYFTAPGLSWDALLKLTSAHIQLLDDYDMILMLTKGIRGGLSQCTHRLAEANNPYMKGGYNAMKPQEYLVYWDANNLYGWAQSQPMPCGDFQWSDCNIDIQDIPDDNATGYILEVDLEYPENFHDLHSDLPLAPEHRTPPGSKQTKLLSTLYDKKSYVVHYRALKFYLSLGMCLSKIHRVLSFSQSAWMKPYINLNTELRAQANNDFEKDFLSL